jgi:UDP-N-acetylmuramate dehydrogenase
MENLSGIPGTVGATPIQNVGAYGVEVSELVTTVRYYDPLQDQFFSLSAADCAFGYRDSWFKSDAGRHVMITAVTLRVSTIPQPRLAYRDLAERFAGAETPTQASVREAVLAIRGAKFPDWQTVGTAGSFFKNPTVTMSQWDELHARWPELPGYPQVDGTVKISLGYILDKVCGLRGYRAGSVGLSPHQALVLINHGGATAADIIEFATWVANRVSMETGVSIEHEVRVV